MIIFGKASCHVLSESLVLSTSPVDTFKQIRTTANGSLLYPHLQFPLKSRHNTDKMGGGGGKVPGV